MGFSNKFMEKIVNPRKLKLGDRLAWDSQAEEIVIHVDDEKFRTVDKECGIHEYSTEGKILNCRKLKKRDSSIFIDDLIGEMEISLLKKCREITEAITLLERLM